MSGSTDWSNLIIKVAFDEVDKTNTEISMSLTCHQIPPGKRRLVISRTRPFSISFRSDFTKAAIPEFKDLTLRKQQLTSKDEDDPINLEIVTVTGKVLAHASTCFSELRKCSVRKKPTALAFFNSENEPLGYCFIEGVAISRKLSFLDYVRNGMEINLMVGIDFTRSNGDPFVQPDSLHANNTDEPNDYVMVIKTVGEILKHYDSDQKFPVYGFGAKLPPYHTYSSDCFALSGDFFTPEVEGIDGILDSYTRALQTVKLHGPSRFAPLLRHAGQWAVSARDAGNRYLLVLIITDGELSDLEETIDEIVTLSELPVSLVIVGVGNGDFEKMKVLDADDSPLYSKGKRMARDIVQFVPFEDFKNKSFQELAVATLEEVPREVMSYFTLHKLQPSESFDFLKASRAKLKAQIVAQGFEPGFVAKVMGEGLPTDNLLHALDVMNFSLARRLNQVSRVPPPDTKKKKIVDEKLSVCKICLDNPCDARLLPCTHQVACMQCSKDLGLLCPLCRATIDKIILI